MAEVNENFLKLQAGYLFPEISRRIRSFQAENPNAKIISLGIGDVTQPLAPAVVHVTTDRLAPEPPAASEAATVSRSRTGCAVPAECRTKILALFLGFCE